MQDDPLLLPWSSRALCPAPLGSRIISPSQLLLLTLLLQSTHVPSCLLCLTHSVSALPTPSIWPPDGSLGLFLTEPWPVGTEPQTSPPSHRQDRGLRRKQMLAGHQLCARHVPRHPLSAPYFPNLVSTSFVECYEELLNKRVPWLCTSGKLHLIKSLAEAPSGLGDDQRPSQVRLITELSSLGFCEPSLRRQLPSFLTAPPGTQ